MGTRAKSFGEAKVVATGVQTSQARFGEARLSNDPRTPIAGWRCNLTALSQTANLYFVAHAEIVSVYVPQYPTQALPKRPIVSLFSDPSTPTRPGYIDPRRPQAINNLIVEFLGSEEVIAVVRDNGDVDAWFVRQVLNAIERISGSEDGLQSDLFEVRPFFQSNVGMSAWGLAIHSQARILATSANTHNITIFKFGLVDAEQELAEDDGNHGLYQVRTDPDRKTDVAINVINGTSNIPHIAFCNTGDDPEARWLLTTDIGGFCRSIDLHEMTTAQTFRFGGQAYMSTHNHDRFNSGWTIAFLDKRSFIEEDHFYAALGFEDGEVDSGLQYNQNLWDLGDSLARIPDCSDQFGFRKRRSTLRRSINGSQLDSSGSGDDPSPADITPDTTMADTTARDEDENDDAMDDNDDELDDEEEEDDDEYDDTIYFVDDIDSEDEGTEDTSNYSAMYNGRRIFGNEPRASQFNNKSICSDLPCPILHSSVRSVYLLQPPHCSVADKAISESAFTPPTVGFTNALRQAVPPQYGWINSIERLNMCAQIPAIGVVVLASQKGRVLVISLTKIARGAGFPPPEYVKTKCLPNTVYGMRVDRVLPLASQEAAGERPFEPLAGIATGPIQGSEHLPDEQKRWRLMLMYYNHTILSYEISRSKCRGNSAVGVQDLVV